MKNLTLVIPCYYNELNIPHTGEALKELRKNTEHLFNLSVVLVDDGSKDATFVKIEEFQKAESGWVKSVKLTRNFGSSAAVLAGITLVESDIYVFMSADLQDPPELIPQMFEYISKGLKVVIANRKSRPESFFNRLFSNIYHFLMRKYGITFVPPGGFDLVMFDKQVRDLLIKSEEPNSFLPYLVMWYGFPYVNIPFERRQRQHGKSSWSFAKKLKSFIDSFVAFSYAPFRFISLIGFVLAIFGVIYCMVIIVRNLIGNIDIPGWSSIMVVLLITSSLQLLSLGVIGEYLWRTLDASRKRPVFVVEKTNGI